VHFVPVFVVHYLDGRIGLGVSFAGNVRSDSILILLFCSCRPSASRRSNAWQPLPGVYYLRRISSLLLFVPSAHIGLFWCFSGRLRTRDESRRGADTLAWCSDPVLICRMHTALAESLSALQIDDGASFDIRKDLN
jgi:hypothetical protein